MTTQPRHSRPSHPGRPPRVRRAARAGAVVLPPASVLVAAPVVAATPVTWNDPPPMSLLQVLLIFGGIPLALFAVITLLVLAPSLIRGDGQQRGVDSWTEPQWFGRPGDALPAGRERTPAEIGAGAGEAARPGGASARW